MALENVVVQGGALGIQAPVTGAVTITGVPSLKVGVMVGGVFKGVYKGAVGFSVATGCTNGTCTSVAPYTDSIGGGADKNLAEGEKPLLEGDTKSCSIPGQLSGGGACTISAVIKVNSTGQNKVLME